MAQAWNIIHRNYVDRAALQSSVLTHAAIQGMTDSLGDAGHTIYLSPEMHRQASASMRSNFTGIGIELKSQDRRAIVVAAFDGSPALLAGLRAGDILLEVDGRAIAGLPLTQLEDLIRGPAGAPVKLAVLDPVEGRRKEFNIVRASIKIPNVTWHALPGVQVAHLRIARFGDGVARDFRAALLEIRRQGIERVILDLRNDPGGVLDEAVAVAGEFLSGGNVLLTKNASGEITPVPVKPGGAATNLAVAVLINGGSASASEIVAGALSDAHRALLVGQTTFGTGTVLDQFQLSDGSALMLAVGEWLTPRGRSFWHRGLKPDVEVALPAGGAALFPALESDLTPAALQSCGDAQLLRALSLLTNPPEK
jgi:carboxyl-terminal processing protease